MRCPRSSERCGRQPRAGPAGSRPEPEASRDADSGAAWPRRRPAHGLFVVWSSRSERGLGGNGRHAAASRQGEWETKAPAAPASGSLSLCLSGFPGCRDPRGRLGRPVDAAVGGSGGAGYPRLDALRRRLRSRRAVPRGPVLSGPSAPPFSGRQLVSRSRGPWLQGGGHSARQSPGLRPDRRGAGGGRGATPFAGKSERRQEQRPRAPLGPLRLTLGAGGRPHDRSGPQGGPGNGGRALQRPGAAAGHKGWNPGTSKRGSGDPACAPQDGSAPAAVRRGARRGSRMATT